MSGSLDCGGELALILGGHTSDARGQHLTAWREEALQKRCVLVVDFEGRIGQKGADLSAGPSEASEHASTWWFFRHLRSCGSPYLLSAGLAGACALSVGTGPTRRRDLSWGSRAVNHQFPIRAVRPDLPLLTTVIHSARLSADAIVVPGLERTLNSGATQPLVLIGARSKPRGQQLEHLLTDDGRVAVLGVHTMAEPLLRALSASPASAMVLDSQLADGSSLDLLYRAMMRRPCAIVALAGDNSGDFALEAIRAGAANCVSWEPTRASSGILAQAVVAAVEQLDEPLQAGLIRTEDVENPVKSGEPTRTVVGLIGSRRALVACDAAEFIPAGFSGALISDQTVSSGAFNVFVDTLRDFSSLVVHTARTTQLLSGGLYLFGPDLTLQLSSVGHPANLGLTKSDTASDKAERIRWLRTLLTARQKHDYELVLVAHGDLQDDVVALLSALVNAGAALARVVPGGYQIRWPGSSQPETLGVQEFWRHLHQQLRERDVSAAEGEA